MPEALQTALIAGGILFLLVFLFVLGKYANLYLQSVLTGARIGLFDMFTMSLRKVPPAVIVREAIKARQARIEGIERRDLEAHLLAGGRLSRVVDALISANRAGIAVVEVFLPKKSTQTPSDPAH